MSPKPLAVRTIIVAGGGIVGWSTAAALRRRIPALAVTVLPVPSPADALADRIGTTLPSILDFHNDIGISEGDIVSRIGCNFRLGTAFEGWTDGDDYIHAYGDYGRPLGTTSFHLHWVRARQAGRVAPFDSHSPAAAMGRAGRFVHPQGEPGSPLAGFGYGLRIDPERYRQMLRAYALHVGVAEGPGTIEGVSMRAEDGHIAGVQVGDGIEISADLYVDCTGPAALLRSRLDDGWEDWSDYLLADRVLFADALQQAEPPSLDRAVALAAGWRWESAGPQTTSHGLVYASGEYSDSSAVRVLQSSASATASEAPVTLRQGRRPDPWLRNCIAIGDAAVAIEPLEWTNLHLAHSMIDRLVAKMPDRDFSTVELWDYNRESATEAQRARDFVQLHYVASRRPKNDFWRAAAAVDLPDSLAHTLRLFRERGRLPLHEEETFTRNSWAAVLLGQGIIPRRSDPIIDAIPADQADRAMSQLRERISEIVPTLPTQGAYLRRIMASLPR